MAALREGILAYHDSFAGLVSVRVLAITPEGVLVRTTNDDVRGFPKGEEFMVSPSTMVQRKVRVDQHGYLKVRSFDE